MTITSHIDIFAEILNSSFFTMKQSEIKKVNIPYVERDIRLDVLQPTYSARSRPSRSATAGTTHFSWHLFK